MSAIKRPKKAKLLFRAALNDGHVVACCVMGGSMRPMFRAHDTVFLQAISLHSIKVGDVLVYERYGQMVMHRVLEVRHPSGILLCKGDRLPALDSPVEMEKVVGRVVARKRDLETVDLTTPVQRLQGKLVARLSLLHARCASLRQRLAFDDKGS